MINHQIKLTRSHKIESNKLVQKTRRYISIIFCVLILTSPVIISQIKPVSAPVTVRQVPDQYPTIQAAVTAANSGDIINVSSKKIYYEHVVVPDTLNSLTLIGDKTNTIVDGTANGTVFRFDAPRVNITGFTIRNAGSGYYGISSQRIASANDYHYIARNIIETSGMGISLGYSNWNTIFNNTLLNTPKQAIDLSNSNNNNITRNKMNDGAYGIRLITAGSTSNTIALNTILGVSFGIYLTASATGNTMTGNTITAQSAGIYINAIGNNADHNTITNSDYGIWVHRSTTAKLDYNLLTNNTYGIRVDYEPAITITSHNITNNRLFYNAWGIEMAYSRGNTLTGNWMQQNAYGLNIISSPYNWIYHNNVIDNSGQINTDSTNYMNKTEGNFWSDYKGKDNNGDGIGDTSYPVGFGYPDYRPLMNKWWEHDILVQNVTATPQTVQGGATVTVNATVKNNGKISPAQTATFKVTAKYNSNTIGTQQVTNLAQGATTNVIFNWITLVAPGTYTISAEASTITDELYTDNNQFTDGTVQITPAHDIAVRTITASRTSAYVGYGSITFRVDVKVIGTIGETFNVTLYHNSTPVETQTVTLGPGENLTLNFVWDTSTVTSGKYIINATADPVPGEYYTTDNTLTFGAVFIKIPGDLNGDHIVDIADYGILSAHWYPGPPIGPLGYDINADINLDTHIDVVDTAIVSAHWGQTG